MIRSVNPPSIESAENRTTHKKLISSWAKQSSQEWEIDQDKLRDDRLLKEEQMEQPVGAEQSHLLHINPPEQTVRWTNYLSIVQPISVSDQFCQTALPLQFQNVDREVAVETNAESILKRDDPCRHCVTLSKQQMAWNQTESLKSGSLAIKDGNEYGQAFEMNVMKLLGNMESCLTQGRLALNKARQETICSLHSNIKDQSNRLEKALFEVVREAVRRWEQVESAQITQQQLSLNGDIAELQTRMDDQIEQIFRSLKSIERRRQISAERRLHSSQSNEIECPEAASGSKHYQNSRVLCEMSQQILEEIEHRRNKVVDTYNANYCTAVLDKSRIELRCCLENILLFKSKTRSLVGEINKTDKVGRRMPNK